MKKKILLIGGSSKVGKSLINVLDKKKYDIHSTYFSKKLKQNYVKQFKLNINDLNDQNILINSTKNMSTIFFLSGVLMGKKLSQFNDDEIYTNFNTNFTSQVVLLKKILDKQKRNCLLIFLSSISGRKGSYDPVYASSKAAMIALVKSISKWEAPKIKCIGICPGLIKDTKMFNSFKKNRLKKLLLENPNKEFVSSEDLANILADLIKPHWRHANGSIIDINGGVF